MADRSEFGGGCTLQEISNIMLKYSKKYELNYSHKKDNRWNLWLGDSGMTLSFVLNRGLVVPSVSGVKKKTLEKFYSTNPADFNSWVGKHIKTYLTMIKEYCNEEEIRRDIENYNEYMKNYYRDIARIDNMYEEVQKYNMEHDEYLTEEEYNKAFNIEPEEVEEVKQLVKKLKPKKKKNKDIPGQMSIFDFMDDGDK